MQNNVTKTTLSQYSHRLPTVKKVTHHHMHAIKTHHIRLNNHTVTSSIFLSHLNSYVVIIFKILSFFCIQDIVKPH